MAEPSTLTDAYDALLTTTLRNYLPRLRDNITRGNRFVNWLKSKGRFNTQDGGERVGVPLMHGLNSTADIYKGYGTLDTTPQGGVTMAFYEWAQLSVSVSISRREERQNSGRHRLLNLLEAKTMQAENSLLELLNNCVLAGRNTSGAASVGGTPEFSARVGRMDSGADGPLPLTAIIDANPSRSRTDIGNINPSTYAFWRNQQVDSAATSFAIYKQDLMNVYLRCSRGVGGQPDLLIGDEIAWRQYWAALQTNERYVITNERTVDILGGTEALAFRTAAFIWDEVVPDVEDGADVVDSIGTIANSTVYFINSQAMDFIVDAQTNMVATPFVRPTNQDARTSQVLWMGAVGTNNRRKLGVLEGISQSITS
jgi:hypothetical protein